MAVQRTNYGVATPDLVPVQVGGMTGYKDPDSGRIFSFNSNGGLVEYNPQTQDFDLQVHGQDLPDTAAWKPYRDSLMAFNNDPANIAISRHTTDSYLDRYGPLAMSLAVPAASLYTAASAAAGAGAGFLDTVSQIPNVIGDKFTGMVGSLEDALGGNVGSLTSGAGSDAADMLTTDMTGFTGNNPSDPFFTGSGAGDTLGIDMNTAPGSDFVTLPTDTSIPGLTLPPSGYTTNLANTASTAPVQTVNGGAGVGAGTTATGTALSRILKGEGTLEDWLSIGGTAGSTALGIWGSKEQAEAFRELSEKSRADRAPYLAKSLEYLNNPSAYIEGPGQAGLQGTLKALSAKFGNPIGAPTALGIASDAALGDWRNAVTGFGNLGLAGEDTRANIEARAIGADANVFNAVGSGLADVTTQRTTLEQLLKAMPKLPGISAP